MKFCAGCAPVVAGGLAGTLLPLREPIFPIFMAVTALAILAAYPGGVFLAGA